MNQFTKIFALLVVAMLAMDVSAFAPVNSKPVASETALQMTKLTYGNKAKDFKPGSKLSAACAQLGVKPKYSCKKGECNSCVISVGGTRMKACVGTVPPEPKLKSLKEQGLPIR